MSAKSKGRDKKSMKPALLSPGLHEKFQQALSLHQGGAIAEAQALYLEVLKQERWHFESRHLLGVSLQQSGQLGRALENLTEAIRLNPHHAPAHYNRANVLKELQRFEEAVASYNSAVSLKPDYVQAYSNRGNALKELKRFGEAIASYDMAISLRPSQAEVHVNRGNALRELKRFDEAVSCYDRAIKLKPDYIEAYCNRGESFRQAKRLDDALACYDRAVALKPDFAPAFSGRGWLFSEWEDWEGAKRDFEKALLHDPGDLMAISGLSRLPERLMTDQRTAELLAALEKAEPGRDLASLDYTRARLLAKLKEYDRSFVYIRRANSRRVIELGEEDHSWKSWFDELEASLKSWKPRAVAESQPAGKKLLVILGPSRSGKTSLEQLLCRESSFFRGFESHQADLAVAKLSSMSLPTTEADQSSESELDHEVLGTLFPHRTGAILEKQYRVLTITNPFLLPAAHRIHDLYGNSCFAFLMRDAVDNAAEMFRTDYRDRLPYAYRPETALAYVKKYNELSLLLAKMMHSRAMMIDYERLLASPGGILSSVHQMLRFHAPNQDFSLADDQNHREVHSPYRTQFLKLLPR